jgi:uncharacterized membrane protein
VLILPHRFGGAVRSVAGWDAAGLAMLVLSWAIIWRFDAIETQCRAAAEDPGRGLAWVIVLVASTFSLFAGSYVLRQASKLAPEYSAVLAILCLGAVVISWLLLHTSYTLRYAHLYYRDDAEGIGGLIFPGDTRPDSFDLAYFSFTVGMCFQVSDVTITSPQIRRAVLGHAMLSFAYNTVILALALNLAFGLVGSAP